MRRRAFPVVPSGRPIYLTAHPHARRRQVLENATPCDVLRQTSRSIVFRRGEVEFCVPKSALVSTNYPDVIGLQRWFSPPERARAFIG